MTSTNNEPWLEHIARAEHSRDRTAMRCDPRYWDALDDSEKYPYFDRARAAYDAFKRLGMIVPEGYTAICENHVYEQCRMHTGTLAFEPCKVDPCPLRKGGA